MEVVLDTEWIPLKEGDIFCSPACGLGCTRVNYEDAIVAGYELACRLGDGWSPRVWENGRWNYQACKGTLTISPTKTGWKALTTTRPQFSSSGPTAQGVLEDILSQGATALLGLTKDLSAIGALDKESKPTPWAAHDFDPVEAVVHDDKLVRDFAVAIQHGDAEHRGWLFDCAEAFVAGEPLPAPRGGSLT